MKMDLNEVKDRVHELEGAIQRLDSVRKHLSRNASDIKTEIHANVSRNLECLRGREVSLLSAVDQVLGVKEDALQGQQARLNQALGVLQTSLSMAGGTDTDRQLAETLDRLNKVELSPEETPYISFRADHLGLREAILSYGRVDANGLPLVTAFDDPSKPSASLPRHLEEYEDVDHHVFYKTVGQAQAGPSPVTSINVTIPKLSTRMEDWLQNVPPASKPATPDPFTSPAKRPSSLPQRVRDGAATASSTLGSSCSLNNWLSLIKQHADLEEEHDFIITDNTGKPETSTPLRVNSTDLFAHIQKDLKFWLQPRAEENHTSSSDFFKHIPSESKVWLAQACSQLRELNASYSKDKTQDPFAHISKEPAMWLRSSKNYKSSATFKVPEIRASESLETRATGDDFFAHISKNRDDWLHSKSKIHKSGEAASSLSHSMSTQDWLMKEKTSSQPTGKPGAPSFQLEDVCRANELCCSMSECVSKPDCVTMYYCTEATSVPLPALCGSSKDTNQRSQALSPQPFKFHHWPSGKIEDWLLPSSHTKLLDCPSDKTAEEEIEKLSVDVQMAEKAEKRDEIKKEKPEEAGVCDFFHMIPSASDPVWLHSASDAPSAKKKGVKKEENLWLKKAPGSPTDALFQEWLFLAKAKASEEAAKEKEDSEGWSIVSDSYSVQSEQHELNVAAADHFINKWLL